ncbi:MAG: hypothetical protein Q9166_008031 [cf. Caloplaca sp. 2 TL-2023]
MSRNDMYLSLCLEQASLSSLHYRHGCIIVRGGKVIGKGYNDYRPGFNGGIDKSTGRLSYSMVAHEPNVCSPKSKISKDYQGTANKQKSSKTYVAFDSRDHEVGTGGGSLANTPLSMHSEMMAINSALSLSSTIACQGTGRSTQWLQKPCFKLPSRSKRQSRLQLLKAYADAICHSAEEQATASERRGGSSHHQADYYDNMEEEEGQQQKEKKVNESKRNNLGNNNVHHHTQINYLEFQKANARKALRQLTNDDNEKQRKQYLYGVPHEIQYHGHHHEKQQSIHRQQHQQHRPSSSAVTVPQNRIVTKSHQVAERMKDSRLNGADLYVARLGKTGKANHFDCGCRHDKPTATEKTRNSEQESNKSPPTKPLTGSLHEELRYPFPNLEKTAPPKSIPNGECLTATYSRPCYRCISYMHSAGIKRVFWTNTKGEWESGKVRDLVDALEGPISKDSDGSAGGVGDVYVTKSEVLLLKGLK